MKHRPCHMFAAAVLGAALTAGPALATEYAAGEIIVMVARGHTIDEVHAVWGTSTIDSYPAARLYRVFEPDVVDLELQAEMMELDAAVEEAEANYLEDTPEGVRNMVLVAVGGTLSEFEDQGITDRIGLDEAHLSNQGAGVTVGIIDTGIDFGHELFVDRIAPGGYDFIDEDADPSEAFDGVDNDGDLDVDEGYGHGTMVAGIISLVAPQAKLLPIRALDDDGTSDAWTLARAVYYAIENGADVINLSLGVPQTVSLVGHQLERGAERGVIFVAAAGNENRDHPPYYPASDSKALMITALDSMDVKADFADFGGKVHVTAPGTGVRSAYPGNAWANGSGCSFAAPFVAGEAALIRSAFPGWWPELVEDRIESAVQPIEQIPGNQAYGGELGSGRIYLPLALAGAAVGVADQSPSISSRPVAFPNPTIGSTTFRFLGAVADDVALATSLYDASGRRVWTATTVGSTVVRWDGRFSSGLPAPPGVYFARIQAGNAVQSGTVRIVR